MPITKNPLRRDFCKHMRSKEMYHSDKPYEEDDLHSGIFWCDSTGDGLGPDGSCADSEDCKFGRSCFEE